MIPIVFFALSIAFYLLQNMANKEFGRRYGKGASAASLSQNGLCVAACALIMGLLGGASPIPAPFLLLALLFGICYLATVFFLMQAMSSGPLGDSTLMCNIGMFISALFGILAFGDSFTPGIAIGGLCMLAAVILSTPKSDQSRSGRWFAFALSSGLVNGITASVKSTAVRLGGDLDLKVFLFWGFLFASLGFLILTLILHDVRRTLVELTGSHPIGVPLCGLLAGLGTSLANLFQMLAVGQVSSAIVYPFTAGFLVVSLWLVSLLIYRETKARAANIIAVLLCVAAIILQNL